MRDSKYQLHIEWSDEDECYVGTCPDLFAGGCHGDSEESVRDELAIIVQDIIEDYKKEGKELPEPTVRTPRMDTALKARRVTKLNQSQFAKAIGVKVGTLRNWEQGRVKPKGAAKTLLYIIENNPNVLKAAINIPTAGIKRRGRYRSGNDGRAVRKFKGKAHATSKSRAKPVAKEAVK